MLDRLSIKQFSLNRYLLIVDLNNILYRAIAVNPFLKGMYKKEKVYTGGIYGTLKQINSVVEKHMIDEMIVCSDKPPYIRTSMYGEYKANRSQKPKELSDKISDSKHLLNKYFKILNIKIWKGKGYEADDLIAAICDKYHKTYSKILIMSNDKDLYQLLVFPNVFVSTKEGKYGREEFLKDYGLPPEKWHLVSALSGGHNGLPGIEGVGEKTAIKMILKGKRFMKSFFKQNKAIKKLSKIAKLPIDTDILEKTPLITKATKRSAKKANSFLKKLGFNT